MTRSARPTVSEYVSSLDPPETPGTFGGRDLVGQRELVRLVAKTNRAKSDLRDLVKKWRCTRIELAGYAEGGAYQACADDAPSSDGDERWLDDGKE